MSTDPDAQRDELLESWEHAAAGWGRRAGDVRQLSVSGWMIDQLSLQPGQRVLELAAGPGDTGFLAAELVKPGGGTLISSDGAEAMLSLARTRAAEMGISNVEFKLLSLEWIDLETASVDAVLCRYGVMLVLDPEAAVREMRRVLRPGGRLALAVWDAPEANPWATIPRRVLVELDLAPALDPDAPGMFSLSDPGRLAELLGAAGFVEVRVEPLETPRAAPSVEAFIEETRDLSFVFSRVYNELSEADQGAVRARIAELLQPYTDGAGAVAVPGRALGATGEA